MKIVRVCLCAALLLMACAAAYASTPKAAIIDVYADSSLSEVLTRIKSNYEAHHQFATISLKFGSSEELARLIKEGAACDIFIPSSAEYLGGIDIISSSRIDLVRKDSSTYPAAVLSSTRNEKPALRFAGYLTNNEAGLEFRREGFAQVQAQMNRPVKTNTKPDAKAAKSKTKQK